jgi:hypothetical protein
VTIILMCDHNTDDITWPQEVARRKEAAREAAVSGAEAERLRQQHSTATRMLAEMQQANAALRAQLKQSAREAAGACGPPTQTPTPPHHYSPSSTYVIALAEVSPVPTPTRTMFVPHTRTHWIQDLDTLTLDTGYRE